MLICDLYGERMFCLILGILPLTFDGAANNSPKAADHKTHTTAESSSGRINREGNALPARQAGP